MGFLSALLARLLGKTATAQTVAAQPSHGEGGFIDIDLALADILKDDRGMVSIFACTKIERVDVGFRVDLDPSWTATEITGAAGQHFYWGTATWRTLGSTSDKFVTSLATLYGLSPPAGPMLDHVAIQVVGLASDPSQVMSQPVKMKLFFGADEGYAEVYLNIDVAARRVEFHEKDPEYRQPLLDALTKRE